eukprot:TRINITY_DN10218_c0_g1_i1.p1 TRINITY_DN10218_c0_g1~~TRINITY_DN10218_c0_g1_i1.p1  ORF type:complete len:178 (+),score=25.58 TRINITY_DN10218_c0_g1_i1:81-614(+)
MASSESMELAWASRVHAGTLPMLPLASLLEAEHSTSSKSVSEVESTSSGHRMEEILRAPPGADVRAMLSAFCADSRRSRNRPMATSRTPTADTDELETPEDPVAPIGNYPQSPAIAGAPLRPGAFSGSHSQSPAITEAGKGLTGVHQQPDASSSGARPAAMESGRAVNARGRPLISL